MPAIRSFLSLAALLALCASASAMAALPRFPKGQDYGRTRKALLAQGWAPLHLPGADPCRPGDRRCAGRPEMFACAGTGVAPCLFLWRRGAVTIEVATYGEERARVSRITCRTGCG